MTSLVADHRRVRSRGARRAKVSWKSWMAAAASSASFGWLTAHPPPAAWHGRTPGARCGARPDGTGMRCAGCSTSCRPASAGLRFGFGPRRRGPRRHGRAAARADACGDGELEAVGACAVVILGLAVECVVEPSPAPVPPPPGSARSGCVGGGRTALPSLSGAGVPPAPCGSAAAPGRAPRGGSPRPCGAAATDASARPSAVPASQSSAMPRASRSQFVDGVRCIGERAGLLDVRRRSPVARWCRLLVPGAWRVAARRDAVSPVRTKSMRRSPATKRGGVGRSFGASDDDEREQRAHGHGKREAPAGITSGTTSSGRQRVRVSRPCAARSSRNPPSVRPSSSSSDGRRPLRSRARVDPPRGVAGAEPPAHRTLPEEDRGDGNGEQPAQEGHHECGAAAPHGDRHHGDRRHRAGRHPLRQRVVQLVQVVAPADRVHLSAERPGGRFRRRHAPRQIPVSSQRQCSGLTARPGLRERQGALGEHGAQVDGGGGDRVGRVAGGGSTRRRDEPERRDRAVLRPQRLSRPGARVLATDLAADRAHRAARGGPSRGRDQPRVRVSVQLRRRCAGAAGRVAGRSSRNAVETQGRRRGEDRLRRTCTPTSTAGRAGASRAASGSARRRRSVAARRLRSDSRPTTSTSGSTRSTSRRRTA